jgi:hypothetical protein
VEPANDHVPPERPGILRRTAATTEVISRKEHARILRRQAYQRAKQIRATDPKHLAMKEALKQRRRDVYQQVKAKRKAAAAEKKSQAKAVQAEERRAEQHGLAQRIRRGPAALDAPPVRPRRPV